MCFEPTHAYPHRDPGDCICSYVLWQSKGKGGLQGCVGVIKLCDVWPFREFARYLLGTDPLVHPLCAVSEFRMCRDAASASGLSFCTGAPGGRRAQWSSTFRLHPRSLYRKPSLPPLLSSAFSLRMVPLYSVYTARLFLSRLLYYPTLAPSRVHPIRRV